MKLLDALQASPVQMAINRSGKRAVQVIAQQDIGPILMPPYYTVLVMRNPDAAVFEHFYEGHVGLADIEEVLRRPINQPPTDDLDPEQWEPLTAR